MVHPSHEVARTRIKGGWGSQYTLACKRCGAMGKDLDNPCAAPRVTKPAPVEKINDKAGTRPPGWGGA